MNHLNLVSVSGGKDSTATLLLALKQFPDTTQAVFADTGNEHEEVYAYLDRLERSLGIKITHLKADFTRVLEGKRRFIEANWAEHGVPDEKIQRALAILQPTGIPFLDLCLWKGRFPSRGAQFCTQHLKTEPLIEHAMFFTDHIGVDVWSWQGVRRDESEARRLVEGFEVVGGGLYIWRPIAGWTAQKTVDFVRSCGVELNPLYAQGMTRVGCMPCINARKDEIAEISRRFPEHIARIAEWETLVADVSKRNAATFFAVLTKGKDGSPIEHMARGNIIEVVQWAKTFRGGKVHNPEWDVEAPACSSSYGLCE